MLPMAHVMAVSLWRLWHIRVVNCRGVDGEENVLSLHICLTVTVYCVVGTRPVSRIWLVTAVMASVSRVLTARQVTLYRAAGSPCQESRAEVSLRLSAARLSGLGHAEWTTCTLSMHSGVPGVLS